MALQWYPGHMTKARRELAALLPSQDVVIEVLDARLPLSSSNPMLAQLRGDQPAIKVLTKSDLADPLVTAAWVRHFEREANVHAFASTTKHPSALRQQIAEWARKLAAPRGPGRALRAVIAGVPNVGKSTLINTLMNRAVAKVGDKPAVTQHQQVVTLPSGMQVTDSPGLMWPKIENEQQAFRLALAGSIPDTAIDYLTIGMFGAQFLLAQYAQLVATRYKLPAPPKDAEALLFIVGSRRGLLRAGGVVDLHKAAEVLVHEFRAGTIGAISLEKPPDPEPRIDPETRTPQAPGDDPGDDSGDDSGVGAGDELDA
jgi:ribosome biogenesis GTPase A